VNDSAPVERPALIHHFADAGQWMAQKDSGVYAPIGWQREGFIHCATAAQIAGVAQRHLQGRTNLLRLTLDSAALGDAVRYEWSAASGDWYPHVYGMIAVAAVTAVEAFMP